MALRTILEYNGTYYIFTIASDTTSPKSYYGNELTLRRRDPDSPWQYFLKTYDGTEVLVFTLYSFHENNCIRKFKLVSTRFQTVDPKQNLYTDYKARKFPVPFINLRY